MPRWSRRGGTTRRFGSTNVAAFGRGGSSIGFTGGTSREAESRMNSSLRESDIRPADLEQWVLAAQRREIEEQFLDPAGGQLRADRTVRVGCLCGRKAACQV